MKKSLRIISIAFMIAALLVVLNPMTTGKNTGIVSAAGDGIREADLGIYTVEKGDSLYHIAKRFGTTINNLQRDNGLNSDLIFPGQVLVVRDQSMDEIRIVIKKTHQKLAIYKGDTEIKIYKAHFGEGGMGDKKVQGDRMTPEGTFYVTQKAILSPVDEYLGSRWMRLSYPNIEDAQRGLSQGIIDKATHDSIVWAINNGETPPQRTALGGGIGIHGGDIPEFGDNWTWGCIGLSNKDAEEIYNYVSLGTQVVITR